ncbi:hypothetical protein SEMRO_274_G105270.1 [Seminavis robusta]|uniref:Uncharacterized protein n=1 Tax=Seminavis robusta TaxID=568900 RepID=A0A9N8DTC5_9STRA|nr:hypothetical protein SEMRO_274_G105270.1 [Seminavis robusta]|eukprot:Sro274_g105270.1 n/a (152) ;mRNA; f:7068-7523
MKVSWKVLAATCESQAGDTAATVARIEVKTNGGDTSILKGPVTLQQIGDTTLFRICVHPENKRYNYSVLCLPPDAKWTASPPKKIISMRSRMKAIKQVVSLPPDHHEGFQELVITMPFDGDKGTAFFFCEALVFASQQVLGIILAEELTEN